jgi:Papain family cysteine protease
MTKLKLILLFLYHYSSLFAQHSTGFILPNDQEVREIKSQKARTFGLAMDDVDKIDHFELDKSHDRSFDLRDENMVTSIKDQGALCGSCWAFATAAAIESSYLLRNSRETDLSENQFLFCSNSGSCQGGRMDRLLGWLEQTNKSIKTESESPYDPIYPRPNGDCKDGLRDIKVINFGFVSQSPLMPSRIDEIKSALSKHGAIITSLVATPRLQSFGGGNVYNEPLYGYQTNHAVVIIGWDDTKRAWLIKNSWSERWGDNGFAWIDFNSSNIGVMSLWVDSNVNNRDENENEDDTNTATISISDRLDSNDEIGEQVYEEIYLTINSKEYVYTLSRSRSSNETKSIILPRSGDYGFSLKSMTHFVKNGALIVKSGTGTGTIRVTDGAEFELKVATFLNDRQYKVKIVKK